MAGTESQWVHLAATDTVAAGILPAVEPVLPARRNWLRKHQWLLIHHGPGNFTVLPGRQAAARPRRQRCPPLLFQGSGKLRNRNGRILTLPLNSGAMPPSKPFAGRPTSLSALINGAEPG